MTQHADDPVFCVCRPVVGDVFVRWSELTPEEQAAAWDHHNKTVGDKKDSK